MAVVLVAFALLARSPFAAVVLLVLFGTIGFAIGPTVQNGVIEAAQLRGGSLVSAANQGAFNVANALGALVISEGLGYTAPIWVGAALALAGAGIALLARTADRRARARHVDTTRADVDLWLEVFGSLRPAVTSPVPVPSRRVVPEAALAG